MNVYIKTYGCQMNERDSDALSAILQKRGYSIVDDEIKADILLFNTCSVREQAELKAVGKVGILKRLKNKRPDIFIGVFGCMAQRKGDELLKEIPHLDFVIGTDQLEKLPDVLEGVLSNRKQISMTEENGNLQESMSEHFKGDIIEHVAVMRGCDMFCSYCIVPYVRGREKSRAISDIVSEVKKLADQGTKEINLLGQNVSAFGLNQSMNSRPIESPFANLLEAVCEIDSIKRVRFISPHPYFFNDKLIESIINLQPKVCNCIHLPLQSGSDSILKKMNRRYTSDIYLDIIDKLRAKIQDITFSTDIIVGFPGETEKDFEDTRRIVNYVGFDNMYIFKYSPREGTPSVKYLDQVPQEVKENRNQVLLEDLSKLTTLRNKSMVGKTYEILVEGKSSRNDNRLSGRTTNNKTAVFDVDPEIKKGDIVSLKIDRSTSMTLFGSLIKP